MLARAFVLLLAACAAAPKQPITVGVLVDGERDEVVSALPARAIAGLELQPVALPVAEPARDHVTGVLARARSAWAAGKSDECRAAVATLDVARLLAGGHRDAAARALTLEAGCAYQANARADVQRVATRFAAHGLELPSQAVGFEVEQLIGSAIEAANQLPRHSIAIRGETGARIVIDGLPGGCSVPCAIELVAGEHVIALEHDGFEPAWQIVRVPDSKQITITQPRATAQRAALQWRARIGRGLPPTDAIGIALLALATRQPRLAYIHAGNQLVGSMIVDGTERATGTRVRGEGPALVRELAYDARILQRPPVWQRPWFWIAVAGGALAISGAITYVTYEPEVRSMVGFF